MSFSFKIRDSQLKQENRRKKLFFGLSLYLILCAISFFSIFSIEYHSDQAIGSELLLLKKNYAKQLLWISISIGIGIIILSVKNLNISITAMALYYIGISIMIITIFIGSYNRGSHSWIKVGGMHIQFAEIMIFITLLYLSKYISNIDFNIHKKQYRIRAIAIFLLPFLITVAQKELGLGLVFLSLIFVLYREGLPGYFILIPFYLLLIGVLSITLSAQYFMIGISAVIIGIYLFFRRHLHKNKLIFLSIFIIAGISIFLQSYLLPWCVQRTLKPYQINRIYNAFNFSEKMLTFEEADAKKQPDNYNVFQSIIAIGSGGWSGKGFLKNTQTRLNFVPEQATDFIFCSYAESFGFLGVLLLLACYIIMIIRMLHFAEAQRNTQIRAYTYGFIAILAFHITINLGMTVGLLPVIGIPLPFVSYGGASFITFSIMYFFYLQFSLYQSHY